MDHRIKQFAVAGSVLAVLGVAAIAVSTRPVSARPTITVYKTPT